MLFIRERYGTTREGGRTREGQHDERVGEKVQTIKTKMTETTMTETTTTTMTVTVTMTMNDEDNDANRGGNSTTSRSERGATREVLT